MRLPWETGADASPKRSAYVIILGDLGVVNIKQEPRLPSAFCDANAAAARRQRIDQPRSDKETSLLLA